MIFIYIPKRYLVALLTSIGLFILTIVQTNFAITNSLILNRKTLEKNLTKKHSIEFHQFNDFNWTSIDLSYLNSLFYIGYLLTHIPSGFLVHQCSATKMFLFPLILLFLLNLILPIVFQCQCQSVSHQIHYYLTGILRFVQGLCAGCAFPSSHGIIANWCPTNERGRIGSFIYTGLYAGPIVGFSLGSILTESFGHYSIYYGSGLFGLIWSFIYYLLIFEYPNEHPRISKQELLLIENNSEKPKMNEENLEKFNKNEIPWKSILTSLPVWSISVAHFARGWTFYLLLTNQPTFLNAFGFNQMNNGIFGSIPHIFKVFIALISGFIADLLHLKYIWSITNIRKLMTSTGYFIEGTCLLVICYVKNIYFILILLTIGVGSSGLMVSGWHLNHQDLSPRYSSIIAGLTAVIGTSAAILSPIVAGILTKNQTFDEWSQVFQIVSIILFSSGLFYLLFASGELQSWSNGNINQEYIQFNSKRLPSLLNSFRYQQQQQQGFYHRDRFYSSFS